jgi:uncharacterized protein YjiS (DUF1127 family)
MRASTANGQFGFSLGNLSYIGPSYEEADAAVVKPARRGLGGFLQRLAHGFVEWRRQNALTEQMARMSDRELADIGLTRGDLPYVLGAGFATEQTRGRDHVAY